MTLSLLVGVGTSVAVTVPASTDLRANLNPEGRVHWSQIDVGSGLMPEITITDSLYPNDLGVQFLINGEPDDRHSGARPNGFDATGPRDDSVFHVYPAVDLVEGDVVSARWTALDGSTYVSTSTVVPSNAGGETSDTPAGDGDATNPQDSQAGTGSKAESSVVPKPSTNWPRGTTTGVPAGTSGAEASTPRVTEDSTTIDEAASQASVLVDANTR